MKDPIALSDDYSSSSEIEDACLKHGLASNMLENSIDLNNFARPLNIDVSCSPVVTQSCNVVLYDINLGSPAASGSASVEAQSDYSSIPSTEQNSNSINPGASSVVITTSPFKPVVSYSSPGCIGYVEPISTLTSPIESIPGGHELVSFSTPISSGYNETAQAVQELLSADEVCPTQVTEVPYSLETPFSEDVGAPDTSNGREAEVASVSAEHLTAPVSSADKAVSYAPKVRKHTYASLETFDDVLERLSRTHKDFTAFLTALCISESELFDPTESVSIDNTQHMAPPRPAEIRCLPKFQCSLCNVAFMYKDGYEKHLRRHVTLGDFACHICEAKMHGKAEIVEHMKAHVLSDTSPFFCGNCKMDFSVEILFRDHISQHLIRELDAVNKLFGGSGVECTKHPYKCRKCNVESLSASEMMAHFNSEHKDPLKCKQCNLSFSSRVYYFKHMKKKHPSGENTCSTVVAPTKRVIPTETMEKTASHCNASDKNVQSNVGGKRGAMEGNVSDRADKYLKSNVVPCQQVNNLFCDIGSMNLSSKENFVTHKLFHDEQNQGKKQPKLTHRSNLLNDRPGKSTAKEQMVKTAPSRTLSHNASDIDDMVENVTLYVDSGESQLSGNEDELHLNTSHREETETSSPYQVTNDASPWKQYPSKLGRLKKRGRTRSVRLHKKSVSIKDPIAIALSPFKRNTVSEHVKHEIDTALNEGCCVGALANDINDESIQASLPVMPCSRAASGSASVEVQSDCSSIPWTEQNSNSINPGASSVVITTSPFKPVVSYSSPGCIGYVEPISTLTSPIESTPGGHELVSSSTPISSGYNETAQAVQDLLSADEVCPAQVTEVTLSLETPFSEDVGAPDTSNGREAEVASVSSKTVDQLCYFTTDTAMLKPCSVILDKINIPPSGCSLDSVSTCSSCSISDNEYTSIATVQEATPAVYMNTNEEALPAQNNDVSNMDEGAISGVNMSISNINKEACPVLNSDLSITYEGPTPHVLNTTLSNTNEEASAVLTTKVNNARKEETSPVNSIADYADEVMASVANRKVSTIYGENTSAQNKNFSYTDEEADSTLNTRTDVRMKKLKICISDCGQHFQGMQHSASVTGDHHFKSKFGEQYVELQGSSYGMTNAAFPIEPELVNCNQGLDLPENDATDHEQSNHAVQVEVADLYHTETSKLEDIIKPCAVKLALHACQNYLLGLKEQQRIMFRRNAVRTQSLLAEKRQLLSSQVSSTWHFCNLRRCVNKPLRPSRTGLSGSTAGTSHHQKEVSFLEMSPVFMPNEGTINVSIINSDSKKHLTEPNLDHRPDASTLRRRSTCHPHFRRNHTVINHCENLIATSFNENERSAHTRNLSPVTVELPSFNDISADSCPMKMADERVESTADVSTPLGLKFSSVANVIVVDTLRPSHSKTGKRKRKSIDCIVEQLCNSQLEKDSKKVCSDKKDISHSCENKGPEVCKKQLEPLVVVEKLDIQSSGFSASYSTSSTSSQRSVWGKPTNKHA